MVNPALQATVEALSEDERAELVEFIEQTYTRDLPPLSDEQIALLRSRRNDPDPDNWRTPEQTEALLRDLRA